MTDSKAPGARTTTQALPLSFADLQAFDAIIDTRSPGEFALDHIPGAINCPVLSDEERVRVGTLYKQTGSFEAKRLGAALVSRNIATHLEALFAEKPRKWRPLVYCWRGGTRSGAMTHVLRTVGWAALQLEGGYKAWRAHLVRDIDALAPQFNFRVICGRTGSGKSRLLAALTARGAQVLDLELLAAHKGSVLGDTPGTPQPTQKRFESLIWASLSQFDPAQPVFVEAESKKVGALRVPQSLIERMWEGECLEVDADTATRTALLREEYAHLITDRDLLFSKLDFLVGLHSHERIEHWKQLASQSQWDAFVQDMLNTHYDPAYSRSMYRNYRQAEKAAKLALSGIDEGAFDGLAARLIG